MGVANDLDECSDTNERDDQIHHKTRKTSEPRTKATAKGSKRRGGANKDKKHRRATSQGTGEWRMLFLLDHGVCMLTLVTAEGDARLKVQDVATEHSGSSDTNAPNDQIHQKSHEPQGSARKETGKRQAIIGDDHANNKRRRTAKDTNLKSTANELNEGSDASSCHDQFRHKTRTLDLEKKATVKGKGRMGVIGHANDKGQLTVMEDVFEGNAPSNMEDRQSFGELCTIHYIKTAMLTLFTIEVGSGPGTQDVTSGGSLSNGSREPIENRQAAFDDDTVDVNMSFLDGETDDVHSGLLFDYVVI
jgi:hypothetical protein